MNIKSLRVFVYIMEHGTLARASEKLHLSPPAVSRLLHILEEDLGQPLFERIKKRLHPTDSAERLFPEAVRILAALDGIPDFLEHTGAGTQAQLRVLCHPRNATGLAVPAIKRLTEEYPDCRVRLEIQARQNFGNYVAQEQFHLGIGTLPTSQSKIPGEEIGEFQLGVLVRDDHPFAARSSLTAQDLVNENYIALTEGTLLRQIVDGHFLQANVQVLPKYEVSFSLAANRMALDGLGFAITERVSLGADMPDTLCLIPLQPPTMMKVGLFRASSDYQHPLTAELIRHLKDIASELQDTQFVRKAE